MHRRSRAAMIAVFAHAVLSAAVASGQGWSSTHGPTSAGVVLSSMARLANGRLMAGGYDAAAGWLVETDRDGVRTWEGLPYLPRDRMQVSDVLALPDGGFIVGGYGPVELSSSPRNMVVVRLDASRVVTWARSIGRTNWTEQLLGLALQADGSIVACGKDDAGGVLFALSGSGDILWQRGASISRSRVEFLDVAILPGDELAFAGSVSLGVGDTDLVAGRTDRLGGEIWKAHYGGASEERAAAIALLADGELAVAGTTEEAPAANNASMPWILKLGAGDGVIIWSRCASVPSSVGYGVGAAADGGMLATGSASQWVSGGRAVAVKIDADGEREWSFEAGPQSPYSSLREVEALSDGSWLATGGLSNRGWTVRLPPTGGLPAECAIREEAPPALVAGPTIAGTLSWTWVTTSFTSVPIDVTLTEVSRGSSAPCGSQPPPAEVSPAGSSSPLTVTDGTALAWQEATASGSETFDLYRGRLSELGASAGDCLLTGLTVPQAADAELPGSDAFFYLVAGRNPAGRGTLGFGSSGSERIPRTACP